MNRNVEDEAAAGAAATATCDVATLRGTYLLAFDGVFIEGNDQVLFAAAGYLVFDGNGHAKGVTSYSANGEITRKEHFSGTYTVEADCTGTHVVVGATTSSQYDLFIAPDGSMYTFVQTDPGYVASGLNLRGTAKRIGD